MNAIDLIMSDDTKIARVVYVGIEAKIESICNYSYQPSSFSKRDPPWKDRPDRP